MVLPLAAYGVNRFLGARQARQDEDVSRREAAAGILQQNAARLGAPTQNVSAARTGARLDRASEKRQRENVSNLVNFMNKSGAFTGGSGGAIPGDVDPLEQDYLNNPRRY